MHSDPIIRLGAKRLADVWDPRAITGTLGHYVELWIGLELLWQPRAILGFDYTPKPANSQERQADGLPEKSLVFGQ